MVDIVFYALAVVAIGAVVVKKLKDKKE